MLEPVSLASCVESVIGGGMWLRRHYYPLRALFTEVFAWRLCQIEMKSQEDGQVWKLKQIEIHENPEEFFLTGCGRGERHAHCLCICGRISLTPQGSSFYPEDLAGYVEVLCVSVTTP